MLLKDTLVHFPSFEAWKAYLAQTFVPLEVQLQPVPNLCLTAANQHLGALSITELLLPVDTLVKRTATLAKQSEQQLYKITVQLAGCSHIDQNAQQVLLNPGQWAVYDTTQPYQIHSSAQSHFLVLQVTPDQLPISTVHLQAALAKGFSMQQGCGQLIMNMLQNSLKQHSLLSDITAQGAASAILGLIGAQLADFNLADENAVVDLHQVQLLKVQHYIQQNLHLAELNVEWLCKVFKFSRRYLYNLFAHQHLSPAEYILTQRLESSCKLLSNPNYQRPIFEVAYQHGFKDAAAFSHAFRRHYGVPPSVWRQQAHT